MSRIRAWAKPLLAMTLVLILAFGAMPGGAGPTTQAAPSNHDFANATPIAALPYTTAQSTEGATMQAGAPNVCGGSFGMGPDVWFRVTVSAGSSGAFFLNTGGSNYPVALAAYTGYTLDALTRVTCSDSATGATQIGLECIPGAVYHIQVGANGGLAATLALSTSSCVGGVTTWREDFEDNVADGFTLGSGWVVSSGCGSTPPTPPRWLGFTSPAACVHPSAFGSVSAWRSLDLSGMHQALLRFHHRADFNGLQGAVAIYHPTLGATSLQFVVSPVRSWETQIFDLTPYVGTSVDLSFEAFSSPGASSSPVGWLLDDVRLDAVYLRPDLTVTDLRLTGEGFALEGETASFEAVVRNHGPMAAAASTTRVLLDGSLFATIPTPDLGPGQAVTLGIDPFTATRGAHVLQVVADAQEQLEETLETDNEASFSFVVAPSPILASIEMTRASYTPLEQAEGLVRVLREENDAAIGGAAVNLTVRYRSGAAGLDGLLPEACTVFHAQGITGDDGTLPFTVPLGLATRCGAGPALLELPTLLPGSRYEVTAEAIVAWSQATGTATFQVGVA